MKVQKTALPEVSSFFLKKHFFLLCTILLALMAIARLMTLGMAPLFDTTENRYANIAQQMILRQDWITPYSPAFHQAFLAKPPFSFWSEAASYIAFGCNEFSARFPNFIEGILTLLFTFWIARKWFDKRTCYLAPIILFSSVLFFIESATVSMDSGVCLMVTASIWSYLSILQAKQQGAQWKQVAYELLLGLFFGFGLLNKGPISLVLFLGPIGLYALFKRRLSLLLAPRWLIVLPVGIAIALPWYLAAQKASPDFFNYFFVHEHFLRYLKSDYGDRYGAGRHQPYGMSWLFMLAAFLPWSFLFVPIISYLKQMRFFSRANRRDLPDSLVFLFAWILFAPLFFTFAKSILMTYLLTSLPPLAILSARFISLSIYRLKKEGNLSPAPRLFLLDPWRCMAFIAVIVFVATVGLMVYALWPMKVSPNLLVAGLGLLAVGLFLIFMARLVSGKQTAGNFKWLFLLAATGMVFSISYWYAFLSGSAGQSRTMQGALSELERKLPDYRSREVYFWRIPAPFSWYFYSQMDKVNEMVRTRAARPFYFAEPIEYDKKLPASRHFLLITTKPFLPRLQRNYPDYYAHGLISHYGIYYVFDIQQN
jgi:4-amino-4-deoxy-L-arabinose transferase-like glycosyltransferase